MAGISLFTWNLKGKGDAHDIALAYLRRAAARETLVACLQELPGNSRVALARLSGTGKVHSPDLRVVGLTRPVRGLALLHHKDLKVERVVEDQDDEFIGAEFSLPGSKKRLAVVGLHAKSKVDMASAEDHGGSRALLRHAISESRLVYDHLVVMGDFNSDLRAHEMQSWHCFYSLAAGAKRKDPTDRRGFAHEPLWAVMPSNDDTMGTFLRTDSSGAFLKTIDFIAVDGATRKRAKSRILTALHTVPLWDAQAGMPTTSDHLPVAGSIQV
jgi:hypothetical protein